MVLVVVVVDTLERKRERKKECEGETWKGRGVRRECE